MMIGFAVIWANPSRIVNRVFFSFSIHVGCWLLCVYLTVVKGEQDSWVRLASALGALITPHMWLLKEAILSREKLWPELPRLKYLWLGAATILVALIYTNWYIRPAVHGS